MKEKVFKRRNGFIQNVKRVLTTVAEERDIRKYN